MCANFNTYSNLFGLSHFFILLFYKEPAIEKSKGKLNIVYIF